jgi:fibro-slime domain-containing protein
MCLLIAFFLSRPTHQTPINMEVPIELELTYDANGWTYDAGNGFFPLDKKGFHTGSTSTFHNYHFTMECQMRFLYQGGEVFEFNGDDDVWVFIDQKLVIDLGGMHAPMTGSVALDTLTDLVQGQAYDLSLFHAERHADDSHFRMTTSLEAPPTRKLCTKATTTFPKNQFHAMLGMTQFPIDHAYLTRNTCGGNVYNTNLIPSTGPSFSADCAKVPSAELVYALNKARGGSQSPIAKEKEVLMVTVIDEVGDMYVVLQGGAMPTGTQNLFVVDVGIDTGTCRETNRVQFLKPHSTLFSFSVLVSFSLFLLPLNTCC